MKRICKSVLTLLLSFVFIFGSIPFSGIKGINIRLPKLSDFNLFMLNAKADSCSGTCGVNANWSLDTVTGVLNITGTGDMADYSGNDSPWYSYLSSIKTVIIGNDVTGIGANVFNSCVNLASVTIGSSVSKIGEESFFNCAVLKSISIPDSVTSIGKSAFESCNSLKSVAIPQSTTDIGEYTFGYDRIYDEDAGTYSDVLLSGFVIYCSDNSAGLNYAKDNAIKFTVPAAPAKLKAVSASYNSIKLSWAVVSYDSKYFIFCSTLPGGTYKKVAAITAVNYNATSLVTGKAYYFKVLTCKTYFGTNIYSAETGVVSAKPVPSTPGSLKAVKASSSSAKTSWSAVSGASGYVVYRYNPATEVFEKVKVTKLTNFTETQLVTWRAYYYKVAAYCTVNSKNIYGNPTAEAVAAVTPAAPVSLKAVSVSKDIIFGMIKISWAKVSGATGYVIYRYQSGKYYALNSTTSSTYIDDQLEIGSTYRYKIRAYKAVNKVILLTELSSAVSGTANPPPIVLPQR